MRWLATALAAGWLSWAAMASADDGMPAAVLDRIKGATVFVKVRSAIGMSSGSGFVIRNSADTCYIATNAHVVDEHEDQITIIIRGTTVARPPSRPPSYYRSPTSRIPSSSRSTIPSRSSIPSRPTTPTRTESVAIAVTVDVKAKTIANVVFRSGQKDEWSKDGTIVAFDELRDLSIIKVDRVLRPPKSLEVETSKLYETMPLYAFGFPLGQDRAFGEKHPTISVSKASLSGLENNRLGDLEWVRVDGNLNHGNSGGPVVNDQGKLVGICTRGNPAAGVIQCVPGTDVKKLFAGKANNYVLSQIEDSKKGNMIATARIVDPIQTDPKQKVKSLALCYLRVANDSEQPAKVPLDEDSGATVVPLKIDDEKATAEFAVEFNGQPTTTICAQFKTTTVEGTVTWSEMAHATLIAPVKADVAGKAPAQAPAAKEMAKPAAPEGELLADADINPILAVMTGGKDLADKKKAVTRLIGARPAKPRPDVARALETFYLDDGMTQGRLDVANLSSRGALKTAAAKALVTWADRATEKMMLEALNLPPNKIYGDTLEILAKRNVTQAITPTAKLLGKHSSADNALVIYGQQAEKATIEMLVDKSAATRSAACKVLASVGTQGSLAKLAIAAQDDDAGVRSSAKSAVQQIQSRLQNLAAAAAAGIPAAAAPATGTPTETPTLPTQPAGPLTDEAVSTLLGALRLGQASNVQQAARRFASEAPTTPRPDVARALEAVVAGNDAIARMDAVKALGLWGDEGSAQALMTALAAEDVTLRREAMQAASKLGIVEALPRVIAALNDFFLRDTAVAGLKAFGSLAEDAVVKLLDDNDFAIRGTACEILGEIGTELSLPKLNALAAENMGILQPRAQAALARIFERQAKKKAAEENTK